MPNSLATLDQGVLKIENLGKRFGDNQVLTDVSLDVRPGRVHALLGHNGSGKSTLIKALAGVYSIDAGSVTRDQTELRSASPQSSADLGIRVVHQRKNVVDQMSGADNLGLGGTFSKRGPFVDKKAQTKRAVAVVEKLAKDVRWDPRLEMSDGPELVKTYLAIGRAVEQLATESILILDEPTASLSPAESDELLTSIKQLKNSGVGVLYVSHRLREVIEIADDITVLSDGKVILQGLASDFTLDDIIVALTPSENEDSRAVFTESISVQTAVGSAKRSEFAVTGLSTESLQGIDINVQPGEILGVAGLDGSGREEVARALGGLDPDATVLEVSTSSGKNDKLSTRIASELGISLALESRSPGAVVNEMTISENIVLRSRTGRSPIKKQEAKTIAADWVKRLGIIPSDVGTVLSDMSGGNRQKVVIASALTVQPSALVVEDPTAGVDIAAAVRLRQTIIEYSEQEETPVLWVSSDLEELELVADRVLCIRDGEIITILEEGEISERSILAAIS